MTILKKYSSFIKIEHTLFSLPLLFSGAFLAGQKWPSLRTLVLILFAGASARVVALGLNRIIDRDLDKLNPRTQSRHIPSGEMSLIEGWGLTLASLLIYLVSTWLISDFCLRLSWIPVVAFAAYPYFKRFTHWTHAGLGAVWALVPLAGFLAVKSSFTGIGPVVMLGFFCLFWLAGFDIIYATLDEQSDRETGIYSLPSSIGATRALKVSAFLHLLSFLILVSLYGIWFSGPLTVMLLVIIGILLFMEQKFSHYVDFAFFQINVIVGTVVFLFVITGLKGY